MNTTTFSELKLCPPLHRALADANYTTPTPIQAAAIPHVLAGRDLLGCAQTGTGKTAAFALPMLNHFHERKTQAVSRAPRALVLAPPRERAAQIAASFRKYGRHTPVHHAVIFGGVGQYQQVQALSKGVHVLVATPGRLLDLMGQGHVTLDRVEVLVLDEADRMLDMGFFPDIRRITAALPKQRQSLFFSATMPHDVAELAATLLSDPVKVAVTPVSSTVERIEQRVLFTGSSDKRSLLRQLLQDAALYQVLVFTRTKRRANDVARQLHSMGVPSDAIHGNKTQNARERALQRFRTGRLRVLVATDIAARGIDVTGISHVINFDLPHEPESYVHRIGRTGRAGASGVAISFCDPQERGQLHAIERLIGQRLETDPAGAERPNHAPPTQHRPGKRRPGQGKFKSKRRFSSRRPAHARS